MFSFGVALLSACTGQEPKFAGIGPCPTASEVERRKDHLAALPTHHTFLRSIIVLCLSNKSHERPTAERLQATLNGMPLPKEPLDDLATSSVGAANARASQETGPQAPYSARNEDTSVDKMSERLHRASLGSSKSVDSSKELSLPERLKLFTSVSFQEEMNPSSQPLRFCF